MNWKFILCWLLSHSFVIAMEANCLRGTRHMWQPKPTPTGGHGAPSCNRPPSLLLPGNATATAEPVAPPATPTMDILAREDAGSEAAHPAVLLANYVYQCATRRPTITSSSTCNEQPDSELSLELVAASAKVSTSGPGSVSGSQ